ncbi:MAG: helix-turn-helix transcriptional regulator [Candidatus Margulisbacteria bacterium]|nr:helix-turn-helix transcriptional regulator [Candidatus Margulisiibacteriota bacterium]
MNIAKNIKILRKEKKMSQEKLSRLADISFPSLTKIESGTTENPTVKTLKKIADVLEVTVDYLIQENA